MASFFNSIGSGLSNTFNTVTGGIGSGINWVSGTGLGHSVGGFFTNTLSSASNLLSGISQIPADFGNLVNGIANNSTLFMVALIGIGAFMLINEFKGSSSSSYYSSGRYG